MTITVTEDQWRIFQSLLKTDQPKTFQEIADETGLEQPTVNGVTVIFSAINPEGQYQDLNRVTSDGTGFYSFSFKPEMEGVYTIIATFEGSEGYYGSCVETAFVVDPAPTPAAPMEPEQPEEPEEPEVPTEPTEPVETPLITTEVAVIIGVASVAVIAVVAFVLLRRRK